MAVTVNQKIFKSQLPVTNFSTALLYNITFGSPQRCVFTSTWLRCALHVSTIKTVVGIKYQKERSKLFESYCECHIGVKCMEQELIMSQSYPIYVTTFGVVFLVGRDKSLIEWISFEEEWRNTPLHHSLHTGYVATIESAHTQIDLMDDLENNAKRKVNLTDKQTNDNKTKHMGKSNIK